MQEIAETVPHRRLACCGQFFLTVKEAADSFKVSERTIYRLLQEGRLRRIKIRGCTRIVAYHTGFADEPWDDGFAPQGPLSAEEMSELGATQAEATP